MQKNTLPKLDEFKSWFPPAPVLIGWLVLMAVFAFAYHSAIAKMFHAWWTQAEMGHGFFVVPFALVLLLIRGRIITRKPDDFDYSSKPQPLELWVPTDRFAAGLGAVIGLVLFVVLFIVYRAGAVIPQPSVSQGDLATSQVQVGDVLPEAELPDLDGNQQSLSELYADKLTLVCFWKGGGASEDAADSVAILKDLQTDFPAKRFSEDKLRIIGINQGDDAQAVAAQIVAAKVTCTNLLDADGKLAGVAAGTLPRVYLLDAEGKVLWFGTGFGATARQDLGEAARAALRLTWSNFNTWVYLLMAGAYGAVLVALVFRVMQLFVQSGVAHKGLAWRECYWLIPIFLLWALTRGVSAHFVVQTVDAFSILPLLVGFALLLGGWRALHWSWPAILFLVFMLPLPGEVQGALAHPLQRVGTRVTVFVVQTLGIPAAAQGNVITTPGGELGVVEACSGLRMLILFFAVCVGAAFAVRMALWEKLVIVGSAMPIAIIANVSRLTVTAICYALATKWPSLIDKDAAQGFIHDWAGYFMMPLALLLLWGEMTLLKKLFIEHVSKGPLSLGGSLARIPRDAETEVTANS